MGWGEDGVGAYLFLMAVTGRSGRRRLKVDHFLVSGVGACRLHSAGLLPCRRRQRSLLTHKTCHHAVIQHWSVWQEVLYTRQCRAIQRTFYQMESRRPQHWTFSGPLLGKHFMSHINIYIMYNRCITKGYTAYLE